jgi:predicted DNA-binding transcriptional regulator AlpA
MKNKIKLKRNFKGLDSETNEQWKKTIETHVMAYLINHRERLIGDYIAQNFSKLMSQDRLLTSKEVENMLQISSSTLGRRIKAGILKPVSPDAKRNYRFRKSDILNYIEGKRGKQ